MKKLLMIILMLVLSACTSSEEEMDRIQQVERDLEKIVASGDSKLYSNPNEYLKAHNVEFNNIVEQKQIALNHFLNKFSESNEDGLEEYIMASACSEILGEKNPVKEWSTGKEWYEQYMEETEE